MTEVNSSNKTLSKIIDTEIISTASETYKHKTILIALQLNHILNYDSSIATKLGLMCHTYTFAKTQTPVRLLKFHILNKHALRKLYTIVLLTPKNCVTPSTPRLPKARASVPRNCLFWHSLSLDINNFF